LIDLRLGDCLTILPTLGKVDAVVTDPPWGVDADTDYTRFTNGLSDHRNHGEGISGDKTSFDPSPWLKYPFVALWGANCFAERLPIGRWLVWLKKRDNQIATFMSDAELCWVKRKKTPRRAPGVYVKRHIWHGFDRESERGRVLHPSQKPVEIMIWTMEMAGIPEGATVLDPYMGSGSTGEACIKTGRHFIGIESDPVHFATAQRRLRSATLPLFGAT
jgi:site-specific DNA-methyltransferase (adenine-specific)